MNIVNNAWGWLTSRSAWNAANNIEKVERELKGKSPPTLAQKIKIGLWDCVSSIPKRMVITCLTGAALSYLFPTAVTLSPECIAFAKTAVPSPISHQAFETIVEVVSEELIYRVGIQNLLKGLERSASPILASLGSLKNRVLISSMIFSINHLSYQYLFANPCTSIAGRASQVIRNILDASYVTLYENYGVAASLSSHFLNNGLTWLPVIIQKFALEVLIQKPRPIRPETGLRLMRYLNITK